MLNEFFVVVVVEFIVYSNKCHFKWVFYLTRNFQSIRKKSQRNMVAWIFWWRVVSRAHCNLCRAISDILSSHNFFEITLFFRQSDSVECMYILCRYLVRHIGCYRYHNVCHTNTSKVYDSTRNLSGTHFIVIPKNFFIHKLLMNELQYIVRKLMQYHSSLTDCCAFSYLTHLTVI